MFPAEEKRGGDKTQPGVRGGEGGEEAEEEGGVQPGSDYIICSKRFETESTQQQEKQENKERKESEQNEFKLEKETHTTHTHG